MFGKFCPRNFVVHLSAWWEMGHNIGNSWSMKFRVGYGTTQCSHCQDAFSFTNELSWILEIQAHFTSRKLFMMFTALFQQIWFTHNITLQEESVLPAGLWFTSIYTVTFTRFHCHVLVSNISTLTSWNLSMTYMQGRKFRLTEGGDNIHKISQEQFLKGTQIIQLKLFL